MLDYNDLLVAVRQACVSMIQTMQLSTFEYGTVIRTEPLQIQCDQKKILTETQLVLTRNVTDYESELSVNWDTETTSEHSHEIEGKKKVTIHNALRNGDKVVLMKQHGGQKYLVIDRVVKI